MTERLYYEVAVSYCETETNHSQYIDTFSEARQWARLNTRRNEVATVQAHILLADVNPSSKLHIAWRADVATFAFALRGERRRL